MQSLRESVAAALCQSLGHHVDLIDPPAWWTASSEPFTVLYATSQVTFIDSIAAATGMVPSPNQLEGYTLAVYELGKSFTAGQYQASLNAIHQFGRAAAVLHQRYDLMLTPTMGAPPLPIGTIDINSPDLEASIAVMLEFLPFTTMANMTGQPAISLPLFWNADNLPIGIQFVGRFGDESLLLRLAAQREAAEPWGHRHPPIWN